MGWTAHWPSRKVTAESLIFTGSGVEQKLTAFRPNLWRAKMGAVNACASANAEREERLNQPETPDGVVRREWPIFMVVSFGWHKLVFELKSVVGMIKFHILDHRVVRSLLDCGAVICFWLCLAAEAKAIESGRKTDAPIDFNKEIRPILAENCYACHGPDESKRKGGLRLDLKNEAFKPAKSGDFALVPGDLAKSQLVQRITTKDEEDQMPPLKSGKKLTPKQIELLKRWVAAGANWKTHWAYVKPERPMLPKVRDKQWPRNELDYFILARLERENLKPNREASRPTLIRRLSLDLIGLPPPAAEVEAFLKDRRPDAYERLVDRLLGSPHYGERWARPWLDQARFADSNGYEADNRRSIWPYRDWVINAFNRDLPFDQFTIEQLAGDLLPQATREQKIATGFHRNTMVNTEGGTDDEEFRVAALVDRVNTTFEVWMGTTLGCAQCHTHKYDPFSQREYYQVMSFFNQTKDRGKNNDPQMDLPTPAQQAKRDELKTRIEPLEKILNTQTPELDAAQAKWEARLQEHWKAIASSWVTLDPEDLKASNGVTLEKLEDQSVRAGGPTPDTSVYELAARLSANDVTAIRLEALVDDRLPQKSSGRSEEGDFVLTDFKVEVQPAKEAKPETVAFETAYADHAMEKYEVKNAIDDKPKSGWSIAAHEATNRVNHHAVFVAKKPFNTGGETRLLLRLKQESDRAQHLIGRFRLSISTASGEALRAWGKVPSNLRALLPTPSEKLTDDQQKELAKYYRSVDPNLDKVREQIAGLKKQEPKNVPTTLVMEVVETNRTTYILIRGSHLNQGEEVPAGVPAVLPPWPAREPTNRLTFARWLMSPENPLVGRVTLNRVWAQYFGRGLVETSEEFGAQGDSPSHPDLLDWLATEFIREGWSLKAMHRLMVNSATYRQSSQATPELVQRDPYNRLLARGPRFRMEAEMVRDNALSVSGLLARKIGGPSVFPHQPEGIWNSPYNSEKWPTSQEGDQFRRGLYTFWRRTAPYASFMAFDAPSREVFCERRPRSNTPVQALVTLNDPAFLAPAAALARRIVNEGGNKDKQRLTYAFKCCLSRAPSSAEVSHLLGLYHESLKKFNQNAAAAEKMAAVGLSKPECKATALAELAAWTVVANVLLNLDETLTKG